MDENKFVTPSEYFDYVKGRKVEATDSMLQKIYDNCLELLNKYNATGQIKAMKKLMFHLNNIERERELVKLGVNTFVYKSDIEDYIEHVADKVVKVIELENYEREIPDEIVKTVEKTKHLFDAMYVVFTDYTGETERKVETEKRAKDPILFGAFMDRNNSVIVERFYFLGDWVDDFCDLTLDKMVAEVEKVQKRDITKNINTPSDIEELRAQLENLVETRNGYVQKEKYSKKPNVFKRVRASIKSSL